MKGLWPLAILLLVAICHGGRRRIPGPLIVNRWYSMEGFGETPYEDCGSVGSNLQKVEVVPCDGDDSCTLNSGGNATFNLQFESKISSSSLKAVVHGIVAGVPIIFHIPQADACKSGVECPLKVGTVYKYSLNIPVRSSYPKLNVEVKWELIADDKTDVVCVKIPTKIR